MKLLSPNSKVKLLITFISIGIFILSKEFSFYWDNIVQISIPAHWYYDNNFQFYFLPDSISTGHPTFIGMLFALAWKIFGKSLFVSHLVMLPFIYGLLWQVYLFSSHIEPQSTMRRLIILLFLIADTTLLSQLSLITFDIIQLFLIFLSINASLDNRKGKLSIFLSLLVLVSMRGFLAAAGVILFDFIYTCIKLKRFTFKRILIYLPCSITLLAFLTHFYLNKGWIIHNPGPQWEVSSKYVDFNLFIRNVAVMGWRFIDFGRITLYLCFTYAVLKITINKKWALTSNRILLISIISQAIIFVPVILIYQNPFGHRYLLPIMIPITILTIHFVLNQVRYKTGLLTLILASLLSGHFWLYPEKIAQGWSSCTLHWNYYGVAKEMNNYISTTTLQTDSIGTFFPHIRYGEITNLNGKNHNFKHASLVSDKYILYSNTFNIQDDIIDSLTHSPTWICLKKIEKNGVYMKLYQNSQGRKP